MHFCLAISSDSGRKRPGWGRSWISKIEGQYLPVTKILLSSLSQAMPTPMKVLTIAAVHGQQLGACSKDSSLAYILCLWKEALLVLYLPHNLLPIARCAIARMASTH